MPITHPNALGYSYTSLQEHKNKSLLKLPSFLQQTLEGCFYGRHQCSPCQTQRSQRQPIPGKPEMERDKPGKKGTVPEQAANPSVLTGHYGHGAGCS